MIKQEKSYLPRESFFEPKKELNTIVSEIKLSKEKLALEEALSMKNFVNNVVIPEVKFFSNVGIRKRRFKINKEWSGLNISRIEEMLALYSIKADLKEEDGIIYLYTSIYPEENTIFSWNCFETKVYTLIEDIIHAYVKKDIIQASLSDVRELNLYIPEAFRHVYYISIINNIFNKNGIEVSYDIKNGFEDVKLSWNENIDNIKNTNIEDVFRDVINFDIKIKSKDINSAVECVVFEGFRNMKEVRNKLDDFISKLENQYNYVDLYMGSIASPKVVEKNVAYLLDIIREVKMEYGKILKNLLALSHKHMFKDDLYSQMVELSEFQKNYPLSDVANTYLKEIDNIFRYSFNAIQKVKAAVTKMVLNIKSKESILYISNMENIKLLLELPEKLDLRCFDMVDFNKIELFYKDFDIDFYNDLLGNIELNRVDYNSESIRLVVKDKRHNESNYQENNAKTYGNYRLVDNGNLHTNIYNDMIENTHEECVVEQKNDTEIMELKENFSERIVNLDSNTIKYYGYLASFFIIVVLIIMLVV